MKLNTMINPRWKAGLILLSASLALGSAQAGGLYNPAFGQPNQGASNAGAGALAEDASTAMQNPAGIMFLEESKWLVTGLLIDTSIKFKQDQASGQLPSSVPDSDGTRPGSNGGEAGSTIIGGGLFYAHPVNDKWGWGIAINSISGAILDHEEPADFVGRYWATEVELLTINVSPSFSYKITDDLSLGLAIPVMLGSLDMEVAIPTTLGAGVVPEGSAQIKDGDDTSVTLGVSLLWQATEGLRLGAAYMGEQELDFDSDLVITRPNDATLEPIAADVEIVYPQMIRTWATRDINANLTLLATLAWEDWSTMDSIPISTPGGSVALPRNFDDTWHVALGLRWSTGGPWTFYTGVSYDSDPTRAGDRTADMPLDEQWRLSGGTTYRFAGGSRLGVSATYADFGDAKIDNGGTRPVTSLPWNVNGDYSTNRGLFLGVNYGW